VSIVVLLLAAMAYADPPTASWHDNQLGRIPIILPGFSPLRMQGERLEMGVGRSYEWRDGLLPTRITSRGQSLIDAFSLVVHVKNRAYPLHSSTLTVTESTSDHAVLRATALVPGIANILARIHVEYDGLAVVDLELQPIGTLRLDGLDVVAKAVRTRDLRLLAFSAETIYEYRKQIVFPACSDLPYKSVIGFTDTDRSFWVLTDEPMLIPDSVRYRTRLVCDDDSVQLRQPLLPAMEVKQPVSIRFAFMATPVRELSGNVRRDRVVASVSRQESLVGNRQLWWVEAFPHYALPYADYPPGVREKITRADQAAFPGLAGNRSSLYNSRMLGIERLPYMSLRAPSGLDATVAKHIADWRVLPPVTMPAVGDGPYRQGIARPLLSHRAAGFSDYLLFRLDGVLENLPVRGFYFDQAAPIASANPAHFPKDARTRPALVTDILAMREFYKRLATAIHARQREPLIYVHNSMATVIPAYSFVTAMVQGEEFNSKLKDLDYQKSTDLEVLQSTYTSSAFGVPVVWLEEVWSDYLAGQRPAQYRTDSSGWVKSPEYRQLWRRFMALALLHDIPVWTLAPAIEREKIYTQLDRFQVSESRFVGYWKLDQNWRQRDFLTSLYIHKDGRVLALVVNRAESPRVPDIAAMMPFLNSELISTEIRAALLRSSLSAGAVAPGDFALINLSTNAR
jgi:hypothetical protein